VEDANDTADDVGTLTNPINPSVNDLTVFTSAGLNHGHQFLREANGLIQLGLNAGTANAELVLTEGDLQDSDTAIDITATSTIITLDDTNDTGDDVGTLLNPVHTSVEDLTVFTSSGSVYGSQFLREANGLIQVNLDSTAATINLKLTEGALGDSDAANDVIATTAIITLEDANDTGDDVGTLSNPIHTSVDDLTVFTSAGNIRGSQFLQEANGLIQVSLDSRTAVIDLKLTEGTLQDADAADDIIATTAVITLEDTNDTGDDVGTLINPIHTSVDDLTVFTNAGNIYGDQFLREANGLIQVNLDSKAALINLKLTEGALQDADTAKDVIATTAVITLEDTNDTGDDAGTLINPIHTSVDDLNVFTSAGRVYGNQFLREANGLIQIHLDSEAGLIHLKLTDGALQDADSVIDISATEAVITLDDMNDSGDDVGRASSLINTAVAELSIFTNAGISHGDHYVRESDGLAAINLAAGNGSVTLVLTDGHLLDSDAAVDVLADTVVFVLEDANDTGDDAGAAMDFLLVQVNHLSVDTAAGLLHGNQYITEVDNLSSVNLNAGTGDLTLIARGRVLDADSDIDICGHTARLTFTELVGNDNRIQTRVDILQMTSVGGGSVFMVEENDLELSGVSITDGSLFIQSGGTLTINGTGIEALGGSVLLTTTGTQSDLRIQAGIRATENILLTSGRHLSIGTETIGVEIRAVGIPARITGIRTDNGVQTLQLDSVDGLFVGQLVEVPKATTLRTLTNDADTFQITAINLQTGEVVLNGQVTGFSGSPLTLHTLRPQTIELAATGNITVFNNSLLSTDDLPFGSYPQPSSGVQDRITIIADRLNTSTPQDSPAVRDDRRSPADLRDPQIGIQRGLVEFGDQVELRTDAGVARIFAPRPMIPDASKGTAFFEDLSDPIPAILEPGKSNDYIAVVNLDIGNPGEEGLRLDIDWRDPDTGSPDVPGKRIEALYFDAGTHEINHRYSVEDFSKYYREARLRDLIIDFSVSHHESIQVLGDAVIQQNFANVLIQRPDPQNNNALLVGDQISSTDRIATGRFNTTDRTTANIERSLLRLASSEDSDADFHFDGGLLLLRIPSMPFAPIETPRPTFTPLPVPQEIPVLLPTNPVLIEAVEVQDAPPESAYEPTKGEFILRQTGWPKTDELEVMAPEEFNDPDTDKANAVSHPNPEQLLNPEELRNWLQQSRPLQDGSDYELLIRTTKRLPDGASVVLERLLLRFDIRDGQPFPAADEQLPAPLPQPELIEIPETEDDAPEPAPAQAELQPVTDTNPESRQNTNPKDSAQPVEIAVPPRPAGFALPGAAAFIVSRALQAATGQRLPSAADLRAAVSRTLRMRDRSATATQPGTN
ncbi:MAG: hypothetical protein ACKOEO_03145, partial [Planctomycetaceae bacterium]